MRVRLIPETGGEPIELAKDMTLVGRTPECDLCIDHKSISKIHCVLVRTEGLVLVRDLGSTNGTRVNGQRIRRGALLPKDRIAFAHTVYLVEFGPAPSRPN
jgi:pSer/pThr/pTyr-binding forkhead associated (FHA) protein